jgi:hypothetical protein
MVEGKLEALEFSIEDWEFIATVLKLAKMDYYEVSHYCGNAIEKKALAELGDQAGRLETEIKTKFNILDD